MKRRNLITAIVAVVLVLGMSVGTAWSYFTDSTTAEGAVSISVKPTTTITEENGPGTKTVRIKNTSTMTPVWVRARVYAPAKLGASAAGTNWSGNIGDWFNYSEVLAPGAETEPLEVKFTLPGKYDEVQNPSGARNKDEINVVVIYECLPASYDQGGNPIAANWNK